METRKHERQNNQEHSAEVPETISVETLETDLTQEFQKFLDADKTFEEKLTKSYSAEEITATKNEIDYTTSINKINSEAVPLWKKRKELRTQELQEIGEIAYDFIREYCKDLGIDVGTFSKDAINWDETFASPKAHYSYKFNHILTKDSSLHIVIHEQIHYAASAKNSEAGKTATEQGIVPEKRQSKTGFVSTWGENEKNVYSNLRSLNEAVTEKMAREIFTKNKSRFEEEYIKRNSDSIEQKKKVTQNYYVEQRAVWNANSKDLYTLYEWGGGGDNGETYEEFYNSQLAIFEKNLQEGGVKIPFNPRVLENVGELYQNEIDIFDAILAKLARHRAHTEAISENEAYTREWTELQQAYLKGNTMALRRIDAVLGEGTLREFNEIDIRKVSDKTEDIEIYRKKANALLTKLRLS